MGHSACRTSIAGQAWLTIGHRSQLSAYAEAREVSELPCRGVSQDGGEFEPGSGLLSLPGLAREHLLTFRSLSVGSERSAGLWTETGAYERWSSAPRISRASSPSHLSHAFSVQDTTASRTLPTGRLWRWSSLLRITFPFPRFISDPSCWRSDDGCRRAASHRAAAHHPAMIDCNSDSGCHAMASADIRAGEAQLAQCHVPCTQIGADRFRSSAALDKRHSLS